MLGGVLMLACLLAYCLVLLLLVPPRLLALPSRVVAFCAAVGPGDRGAPFATHQHRPV